MDVVFCVPELTMKDVKEAQIFCDECKNILDQYITNRIYVLTEYQINQLLSKEISENDILIFFNSENGEYSDKFIKLISKYNEKKCRVWAIAMKNNPECRMPPKPIHMKQSFDVSCRNENRNPLNNNMKAIAQVFARKIVAQMLSPLYQDEVLYFISHRRIDGERIAAKLADELKLLTRERNVYRDVVNVQVGDDAQVDIDANLKESDVVIFLQTEQAQNSVYVIKELCYALVYNIPVLWIQIDNATFDNMSIRPGERPLLSYRSEDFDDAEKLERIADEVEEKCFQLIMNSSNQVYTYVEYLNDMQATDKIKMVVDPNATLAYEIEYKENTKDLYNQGIRKHYIQCYGRNPKEKDIQNFASEIKQHEIYQKNDRVFLLSSHGSREKSSGDVKIIEENYDDYIINLENMSGRKSLIKDKRIIISGAFPDCDEIYKNSLLEALLVYSKEIIKNGYKLVFGAHPTFQKLIFDIGKLYSTDVQYSIEMHMSREYISQYNEEELRENCTLILSDGIDEMRHNMICREKSEMLICLGGKIKDDKKLQGVDEEINLANKSHIPVALVGTVGGRSSELAYEMIQKDNWSMLNSWDKALNEGLFYNVNHRLMIRRLLNEIEK